MFIKIFTPNHNGKIELTVRDLEALIQEAVDKAVREDRADRPYNTWYGTASLSGHTTEIATTPSTDWTKVTCSSNSICSGQEGTITAVLNNDPAISAVKTR